MWAVVILFCFNLWAMSARAQDNPTLSIAEAAVVAHQIDMDHAKLAGQQAKNKDVTILNYHEAGKEGL